MTLMASVEVVSQKQVDPASFAITEVIAAVPANSIAIYTGSTVNESRQVEIMTGWRFLYNGLRDRNLINPGAPGTFYGIPVYTGTDVDKKGEFDRRTESLVATLTNNDIILGVSGEASIAFRGATVNLEACLEQLIQHVSSERLRRDKSTGRDYGTPAGVIDVAAGDHAIPVVMTFSGAPFWEAGTIIEIDGTTSQGVIGTGPITLDRDMQPAEMAFLLGTHLKGWPQSNFDYVTHPGDKTIVSVRGLAAFGGTVITITGLTVT